MQPFNVFQRSFRLNFLKYRRTVTIEMFLARAILSAWPSFSNLYFENSF
jgi:hypothetical protein